MAEYSTEQNFRLAQKMLEQQGTINTLKTERDKLVALVRSLADPNPCYFDPHGGCQEHGYLTPKPTERCPHAEAREVLAAMGIELED